MNGMARFFHGLSRLLLVCLLAPLAVHGACLEDPARAHELRVLDEAQIIDLMDQHPVVAAPQKLHRIMASLISASPRLRAGPSIHLLAYEDDELNAYAADHGMVILTSAMWSEKQALSDDEIAAVIAHELAHIEGRDSLVEACTNLERLGHADLRRLRRHPARRGRRHPRRRRNRIFVIHTRQIGPRTALQHPTGRTGVRFLRHAGGGRRSGCHVLACSASGVLLEKPCETCVSALGDWRR